MLFAHDTFLRQVEKTVLAALSFGIPMFFLAHPMIENLTIGAAVNLVLSWLQSKVN